MILESTYQDLRLLLDTLEGIPLDNQKDIVYREAVQIIVETYEKEQTIINKLNTIVEKQNENQ
tara:strand:- start:26 stop:214 length:189 start_codon:yes stop_codon:yes gene_type:complete